MEVLAEGPARKVYTYRWYALGLFGLTSVAQACVWNTWGPIAASAEKVYGWTDGTIALISNWGPIMFIISTPLFTWLMDVKGMRSAMVLSNLLITIGTGLRCIPAEPSTKTLLIHSGQLLNGVPGPLVMGAPALLSSTWFPVRQRTTATALATVTAGAGLALSFFLGPYLVSDASKNFEKKELPEEQIIKEIRKMEEEIDFYMIISFIGSLVVLFLVLVSFRNKPPTPPSITASSHRLDYFKGVQALLRNDKFWILAIVYGVSLGIYNSYIPVLEVLLKSKDITQEETGLLGFYTTIAGNISPLLVARFADTFKRKLKVYIIVLYFGAAISFAIFSLAYEGWYFTLTKEVMYWSQVGGAVCLLAGVPLFFELSCEASYPVAEGVTTGVVTWLCNLAGLIFLLILMLPSVGTSWMNWTLTGGTVICIPCLMLYTEKYSRPD